MKFIGLVLKSARRSKRRTALTMISVALAVFLFVVAARRARRLRRRVGGQLVDAPRHDPLDVDDLQHADVSHAETIKSTPGVQDVTWANWFGGIYKDPKNFFGQFADRSRELPADVSRDHPDRRRSARRFLEDRTGCIVGDGLAKKYGFKVGDKHRRCRSASRSTDRRTSTSRSAASTRPAAPRSTTSR